MTQGRGLIRTLFYSVTAVTLFGVSCERRPLVEVCDYYGKTDEVVFSASGAALRADVVTKVTQVSSLGSFYAACTTGSPGSESSVWNNVTFTGSGSPLVYKGDRWWPTSDPSYHFYASNAPLVFSSAGTTVSASTSTDVVCAHMPLPTYKVKNTLVFEHIFARLGDVSITAESPYAITSASVKLTPKVSGTYNLRTGPANGSWSSVTEGSETTVASAASLSAGSSVTASNDILLIPGTYTVTATWTAASGSYTETFSGKTSEASFVPGKNTALNVTLRGKTSELTIESVVSDGSSFDTASIPVSDTDFSGSGTNNNWE